jgi:filamentous hemagglutinin family protein
MRGDSAFLSSYNNYQIIIQEEEVMKKCTGNTETGKRRSGPLFALRSGRKAFMAIMVAFTFLSSTFMGSAFGAGPVPTTPLPTGGTVTRGSATFDTSVANKLIINQTTDKAAINWQTYGIDVGNLVKYIQPGASSIALNRVIGADPTVILGQLQANGRIFLINPNGILFGAGSQVDVAGLLATTFNITDDNFMAGTYNFSKVAGMAPSYVINQGTITITNNGLAMLVAPAVSNEGFIVANMGKVVLGSGSEGFTVPVDFWGDGLITFAVDGKVMDQVTGPNGNPMASAVSNSNTIQANGGQVLLTANAAQAAFSSVINQSGIIEAKSLAAKGGRIVLDGGSDGLVSNTGILDVSKNEAGAKPGSVTIFGKVIEVFPTTYAHSIITNGSISINALESLVFDGVTVASVAENQVNTISGSIQINSAGSITINNSHIYSSATTDGITHICDVKATSGDVSVIAAGNMLITDSEIYSLAAVTGAGSFSHVTTTAGRVSVQANGGGILASGSNIYSKAEASGLSNLDCQDSITAKAGSVAVAATGDLSFTNMAIYSAADINNVHHFDRVVVTATAGQVDLAAGGNVGISLKDSPIYSAAKATDLSNFLGDSTITVKSAAVNLNAPNGGISVIGSSTDPATGMPLYAVFSLAQLGDPLVPNDIHNLPSIHLGATSGAVTLNAGGTLAFNTANAYSQAEFNNISNIDCGNAVTAGAVSLTGIDASIISSNVYSQATIKDIAILANVAMTAKAGDVSITTTGPMNLSDSQVYSSAQLTDFNDFQCVRNPYATAGNVLLSSNGGNIDLFGTKIFSGAQISDLSDFDQVSAKATSGSVTLDAAQRDANGAVIGGGNILISGSTDINDNPVPSQIYSYAGFNTLDDFCYSGSTATSGAVSLVGPGPQGIVLGIGTKIYSKAEIQNMNDFNSATMTATSGVVKLDTRAAGPDGYTGGDLTVTESDVFSIATIHDVTNVPQINVTAKSGDVTLAAGNTVNINGTPLWIENPNDPTSSIPVIDTAHTSNIYSKAQMAGFTNLDYASTAQSGNVTLTTTSNPSADNGFIGGDINIIGSSVYSLAEVTGLDWFRNVDITAKSGNVAVNAGGSPYITTSDVFSQAQVINLAHFWGVRNINVTSGGVTVTSQGTPLYDDSGAFLYYIGDVQVTGNSNIYSVAKVDNLDYFDDVKMTVKSGNITMGSNGWINIYDSHVFTEGTITDINKVDYILNVTSGNITLDSPLLSIYNSTVDTAAKAVDLTRVDDLKLTATSGSINLFGRGYGTNVTHDAVIDGDIEISGSTVYSSAKVQDIDTHDVISVTAKAGNITLQTWGSQTVGNLNNVGIINVTDSTIYSDASITNNGHDLVGRYYRATDGKIVYKGATTITP